MTHLFTNNAVSLVAVEIPAYVGIMDITITAGDGDLFASPADGEHQMLTLGTDNGPFEIIKLIGRTDDVLTVIRRQESTTRRAWPIGTVVSARITAGMLGDMVQGGPAAPDDSSAISPKAGAWASGSTAIGSGAVAEMTNAWTIRGAPVIPHDRALFSMGLMGNAGVEAVLTSPFVDLGVPRTWEAATYYADGDIIQPSTPNGYQYRVVVFKNSTTGQLGSSAQSDAVEPTFGTDVGEITVAASEDHAFLCMKPGDGFEMPLPGPFFPSEAGFICCTSNRSGVTSPPSISITDSWAIVLGGTELTQITVGVNGNPAIHREPLSISNSVQSLTFKLDTPAIGGALRGRFFVRGLLVYLNSSS